MHRNTLFLLIIASLLSVFSCSDDEVKIEVSKEKVLVESKIDWDSIVKRKRLKVIIENSSTSYFIYKGKKMGFEYEVLNYFCKEHGLTLDLTIAENLDSISDKLILGEADFIACNYTITPERKAKINFTKPITKSSIVVVQRDDVDSNYTVKEINDLKGKTIHVWKQSSYYTFLDSLNKANDLKINIVGVSGNILGESLIEQVSSAEIDYTIIEKNVAEVNQNFYSNIKYSDDISPIQNIAFGVRNKSYQLKNVFDNWLDSIIDSRKYKYIYHKYFNISKQAKLAHTNYSSLNGNSISKFDAFFKQAEEKSGWDWRLIASVSYQESKFNPNITSFGGAYGMMQFMPNTGPRYNVYPDSSPLVQIIGGAKKLRSDEKYWESIPDVNERKKFAVASYNSGRGHILDAQRLASKYGLDSLVWTDNVSEMVLNLSKREFYQDKAVRHGYLKGYITYHYVESVFLRYNDWSEIYK